jgi:hypothetical protein
LNEDDEKHTEGKYLRAIYNAIDELMMAGHYYLVDAALTVDVASMDDGKMMGILTITKQVSDCYLREKRLLSTV